MRVLMTVISAEMTLIEPPWLKSKAEWDAPMWFKQTKSNHDGIFLTHFLRKYKPDQSNDIN